MIQQGEGESKGSMQDFATNVDTVAVFERLGNLFVVAVLAKEKGQAKSVSLGGRRGEGSC